MKNSWEHYRRGQRGTEIVGRSPFGEVKVLLHVLGGTGIET